MIDIHITRTTAHAPRRRSRGTEEQTPIPGHIPTNGQRSRARPHGIIAQIVAALVHLVLVVHGVVVGVRGALDTAVGHPGGVEPVGED
jgi:hypothetical protein